MSFVKILNNAFYLKQNMLLKNETKFNFLYQNATTVNTIQDRCIELFLESKTAGLDFSILRFILRQSFLQTI